MLRKISRSLRDSGLLLIFQPAIDNPIIKVEMEGNIIYQEVTDERNFRNYLHTTVRAIHQSVSEGTFDILTEVITPEGDDYVCDEYESLVDWEEDRLEFCEDLNAFSAMAERIREIVGDQNHRVLEYWKEYKVLLRKVA